MEEQRLHVYVADIRTLKTTYAQALDLLTEERRTRTQRYLREEDRLRSTAAGLLLRYGLGAGAQSIARAENGKPVLPGGPHFNLSHSADCAVLALADCEIGVDVEKISRVRPNVARRVLCEAEQAWMEEEDALRRFFVLWTRKESAMKQRGLGFRLDPRSFCVLDGCDCRIDGRPVFFITREWRGYMVSFAAETRIAIEFFKELNANELLGGV